jgi:hypothetical protein
MLYTKKQKGKQAAGTAAAAAAAAVTAAEVVVGSGGDHAEVESDAGRSAVGSSEAAMAFLRCTEEGADTNQIELICTSFDTNEEVHEKYADFSSTEPKLKRYVASRTAVHVFSPHFPTTSRPVSRPAPPNLCQ